MIHDHEGRIVGLTGYDPQIVPYDMGGTQGMRNLVPEFLLMPDAYQEPLQQNFHFRYFDAMCRNLEQHGYEERVNMIGIPYDFRLVLDPGVRDRLFSDMRMWIEKATERAGKPALVVTHSLGGVLFKWFLSTQVDQEWIDRYIDHVVGISVPYGGTIYALRAVLCGEYYVPMFHHLFREEMMRNTGIIMCMPNALGVSETQPLLKLDEAVGGVRNVTAASYHALAHEGILPFQIWRDLFAPHQEAIHRRIRVPYTAVISNGMVTPTLFKSKDITTYPFYSNEHHGDGVVHRESLEAYTRLYEGPRGLVLPDATHTSLLSDPRVFDAIKKLM